MRIFILAIASLALLAPVNAVQATGRMTCQTGGPSTWKSREDLTKKITADGWKIRHIKVDGGCYEVYGTSPKGQRVEAYFHPVSLDLLLMARRGEILFRKK
jgi:hypothetical protein